MFPLAVMKAGFETLILDFKGLGEGVRAPALDPSPKLPLNPHFASSFRLCRSKSSRVPAPWAWAASMAFSAIFLG